MKKVISILVSVVMLLGAFAVTASAADDVTPAGFYNIGTNENMEITALSSDGDLSVEEVDVDVDGDGVAELLYTNSDVLEVTYSAASANAYYGIILVEGTGLPTKDNDIYYINQVTAEGDEIAFEVFPKLPEEKTALTLYVSSSVAGASLESVALNYTPAFTAGGEEGGEGGDTPVVPPVDPEPEEPEYVLGDIDSNGLWNATDALAVLQLGGGLWTDATDAEKAAADVNEDTLWNASDALLILQYGGGLITSWK